MIDTLLGIIVLIGERGKDWDLFDDMVDAEWWELRYYFSLN